MSNSYDHSNVKANFDNIEKIRDNIIKINVAIVEHSNDDIAKFSSIESKLDQISASLTSHHNNFNQYVVDQDKTHDVIRAEYSELRLSIHDLKQSAEPVNEWFRNINFSKKMALSFLGVVATLVGISIGLRSLFLPR